MTHISGRASDREDAANAPAIRNLRINTLSLIGSNLVTGVLGLVFWAAAARLYPTDAVGIAAAVISSAMMLAILSMVSLDTLYERFLPVAGHRAEPLLIRGFAVVTVVALLAGVGLVLLGPREAMFQSNWQAACFPLVVVALAVYTTLDRTTAGLGVARWAAAKNSIHSLVKLLVLLAFAWTASSLAIVWSWVGTAAVAVVIIAFAIRRRCRTDPQFLLPPALPARREIIRYFGSSFGLTASWVVGPLVVPLIVLSQFGAAANAHFAVTWAIVNAFYTTVHLILSPYVSEVATHPDKVTTLTRRMVATMVSVNVIGGLGLVAVGPLVLGFVGGEYRSEGAGILYLAALFVPLSAVTGVYEGFARVRRKLGVVMAVRIAGTVLIIGGSAVATRHFGVLGVGWAYLLAEGLCALVLVVPVIRWIRLMKADPAWLTRIQSEDTVV